MRRFLLQVSIAVFVFAATVHGQQTIFNVPSGDVLERGKVYVELDVSTRFQDPSTSLAPRVVVGVGLKIEIGLNVSGVQAPGPQQTTIAPTIKWKAYENANRDWAFVVGDQGIFPLQRRTSSSGNYAWAVIVHRWSRTNTRLSLGGYDYTPGVVASGNRAGGQFTLEQPLGKRVTAAAEWLTGNHANGYATPGVAVNVTPRTTLYVAYPLGNHGVASGNHYFLLEIGINLN